MTIKPRGHHNKVSKYFFTLCHGDWKKKKHSYNNAGKKQTRESTLMVG